MHIYRKYYNTNNEPKIAYTMLTHVIILHTRSCVSDNRRETVDASPPRMEFCCNITVFYVILYYIKILYHCDINTLLYFKLYHIILLRIGWPQRNRWRTSPQLGLCVLWHQIVYYIILYYIIYFEEGVDPLLEVFT